MLRQVLDLSNNISGRVSIPNDLHEVSLPNKRFMGDVLFYVGCIPLGDGV